MMKVTLNKPRIKKFAKKWNWSIVAILFFVSSQIAVSKKMLNEISRLRLIQHQSNMRHYETLSKIRANTYYLLNMLNDIKNVKIEKELEGFKVDDSVMHGELKQVPVRRKDEKSNI